MSDDVILSRAEAANLADFLRHRGIGEHHSLLKRLDPPQPSLRDEVYTAIWDAWQSAASSTVAAASARDAVLAVVQKRVHAMPTRRSLDGLTPQGCYERAIYDVLDLLGVTDE